MKICCICKKEKELSEFSLRKDRLNGLGRQSRCKECCKVYRKNNIDRERVIKAIYRKKNASKINSYHIKYNKDRDSGLYFKWISLKQRIVSKKDKYSYSNRGIKCLWTIYKDFKTDMYDSYIEHLNKYGKIQTSLDRIDNNGNYCKENCRWANWSIQNNNKRKYIDRGNWGKRKGRTFPKIISN